jgi:hypothetical protein
MRTSAKILRTIGQGLTWSGWGQSLRRYYGPWAYRGIPYYYIYRIPSRSPEHADPAARAAGLPRQGG